jgi:hypothetical protein
MEGKSLIFKERWAEFDRVKGSLRTENRQYGPEEMSIGWVPSGPTAIK